MLNVFQFYLSHIEIEHLRHHHVHLLLLLHHHHILLLHAGHPGTHVAHACVHSRVHVAHRALRRIGHPREISVVVLLIRHLVLHVPEVGAGHRRAGHSLLRESLQKWRQRNIFQGTKLAFSMVPTALTGN